MRKPWSSSVRNGALLALALAFGLVTGTAEARVLEHQVAVEVDAAGKVSERWRLRVLIETVEDASDWQRFPIYLDDNRRLVSLDGAVVQAGGERVKIGRKEQDLVQAAGGGILHSSARYQVVSPPGLMPGATLELSFAVEGEPYWPGGLLPLVLADEAVDKIELSLRVAPAAGALHHRLDGPRDGLTFEGDAQRLVVRGSLPKPEPLPELAGGGTVVHPLLRWSFGEKASWESLGAWYTDLLQGVPQGSPEVAKLARELTAGAATPREKLEALVAHVRRKVRYVAVEVGIGGFRPHPPAEVASKLWGDCKDKSFLLVELARAVGLEAWPVLVLFDEDRRIDRDFPTAYQFNHEIAAFAAAPLGPRPGDPVAEGFFFVDPTQELGGAGYLHQGVQDQEAVVILPGRGQLVRLPSLPETASRKLQIELALAADGSAKGRAQLELEGDGAARMQQFLEAAASQTPLEDTLRKIFEAALRGARLSGLTYRAEAGARPRFSAAVTVEHPGYLEGLDRGGSLQAGGLRLFPESRDLELIAGLSAASPGAGILEQSFSFELPPGFCPPEAKEERTENALGLFSTRIEHENGKLELIRRAELRRPWVEKPDYPALQELSVAEARGLQRRVRFACK
jgi:hypothetical protein